MEKRTNGRVKVSYRFDGVLTAPLESLAHLRSGIADLGYAPVSYFPVELGGLASFQALYISKDPGTTMQAANRILFDSGDLSAKIAKEYEKLNIKMLFHIASANYWLLTKKPVSSVADLKGMKIRSTGTYQPKVYSKLGMIPISTTFAEVYDSLAKGLMDAIPFPMGVLVSAKLIEVAKYISFTSGGSADIQLQMNLDTWKKLPPDIQKIIDDLRPEAIAEQLKNVKADEQVGFDKAKAAGVQFIEVPKADQDIFFNAWKDVSYVEWFQDMQKKGKGADGQKLLDSYLPLLGY